MADSVISQSVATPSVGQEQAFLESYFQCLSKFAYDKAKEITVGRLECDLEYRKFCSNTQD